MPHAPATRPHAELLTARRHAAAISMVEKIPSPDAGRFPFRSVVLGLLSLQSAIGLTQENELGGLIARFTDGMMWPRGSTMSRAGANTRPEWPIRFTCWSKSAGMGISIDFIAVR